MALRPSSELDYARHVVLTFFRTAWTVAVLLACVSVEADTHKAVRIRYVFSPDVSDPHAPTLHVRLEFMGDLSGKSTIVLPTTWAGQAGLYNSIKNFEAFAPTVVVQQVNPANTIVHYPPNHKVTITYDLADDWQGPLRHPTEFRAVLRSTNIIFNGQNGLVYPQLAQSDEVQAVFEWANLPGQWIAASSFGTAKTKTRFRGQWRRVHEALFAAGDFRLTSLHSGGEHLILAARGSWSFSDSEAAREIMSLFRVERQFWQERKHDRFLVVLTPYDQDIGSSDGTAFTESFLLYLSRKQTFVIDIKSQLAHEIFHTWNPYRMGEPSGEPTAWFTEGFTTYYQDRILRWAGLISLQEYLDRLNNVISEYWSSPIRNWSQRQWLDRTHTGNAEYELPYTRGAVIALWLDEQLRTSSRGKRSLDDSMLALLKTEHGRLTTDFLIELLSQGLNDQNKASFRSLVEDGLIIPLPTQLDIGCAELVPLSSPPRYEPASQGCDRPKSEPR